MTNLEFYKHEIKNIVNNKDLSLGCSICRLRDKKTMCNLITCNECSLKNIDWLCEEHKEPIPLKQWEFDYLDFTTKSTSAFGIQNTCVRGMKKRGYFRGIPDTAENLEEILSNCIIVADDYDFGGNEE